MTPLIPSGRHWITTEDQPFTLTDGTVILVPLGYQFDGHSIPSIFRPWVNPFSYDMYAALYHDYCYEFNIGTRKQVDFEYLQFMQQLGTGVIRRYTFYYFVRLVSWLFW